MGSLASHVRSVLPLSHTKPSMVDGSAATVIAGFWNPAVREAEAEAVFAERAAFTADALWASKE